ncbi:response regulator [Streptomyces sp. NPDC090798]|uniref:response regulator n=1 Tax=Streptomyces sp. NPDC090798 TaxID=3365968 RepID=UPI0038282097
MIRVLIAEDERLIREALAVLLSLEDDIEVVAQTGTGDEVVGLAAAHRCDVAVLDIDMPGINGLTAAERLRSDQPGCAVIVLTSHGRPGYLRRAVHAGVRGFLTKEVAGDRLAQIVREVHGGGRYIDPVLASDAIAVGESPLSRRELEVLRLAEDGRPLPRIAEELSLSEGTVRNYVSAAIQKLGASSKLHAIRIATQAGWL